MNIRKRPTLTVHTLSMITEKLGYQKLQDWQVSLTRSILDGKDVVFTAGTGCGKTTLLYAPLLAFRLEDPTAVGLSITPTKALGRDQVCHSPSPFIALLRRSQERSARLKGIPAIAIDEDTASHAALNDHRNLVNEALNGKFGLVIVSPEMLTSDRFNPLLASPKFRDRLHLVFIDECHLVEEHGSDFRPSYKEIGQLRHRLPSSIPWVAVSATLPGGQTFDKVMISLGFNPGCYVRDRLPIDNPHICYLPQFFRHPTSGTTFLDISWLIPSTITSAAKITKSLVFCDTINLGTHVYRFLQQLLPQPLSSDKVILPYHSLISEEGRLRAMERFRSGSTRIIIASDCFTWGVDVPDIRQVIVFGLPSSFSKLVQQMGRAGRDKQQAYAITYSPAWVEDLEPKDPEKPTKHEVTNLKRREGMCQALCTWFNPPQSSCPREIFCSYFGDQPSRPKNCCIKHNKVLPNTTPEPSRTEALSTKRTKGPVRRSDGTYMPFAKKGNPLRDSVSDMISAWVRRAWDEVREQNSLLPPTSFLSQELQDNLRDQFHRITTIENLCSVLADWPRLEQYKTRLFSFCEAALKGLEGLRSEVRDRREAEENQEKCQAGEGHPPKIRIRPLVSLEQSENGGNDPRQDGSGEGAPPRKRRRLEPSTVG